MDRGPVKRTTETAFARDRFSRRTALRGAATVGVAAGLADRRQTTAAPIRQDAQPTRGGTLTAGITGQPDNLDPATNVGYSGVQVYCNVFSKLIDVDETGQLVPQLATSWTAVD